MKCPYRTIITHQPEHEEGYTVYFAKDITEFAECYKVTCPYYDMLSDKCKKVEKEIKRFNE